MNYEALLFCPQDKTARVISQVLNELDFAVEPCVEPFAAVKHLMAHRFDAVVVDCDDEQNAALLFKSVRNSQANQAALMVAIVGGQAGVAKAFRLGANLVLTKPINVEQSKGTLRVARGLLRKGDSARPTGGNVSASDASTSPTPTAPQHADAFVSSVPQSTHVSSPHSAIAQWPASSRIPSIAASTLELEAEPTSETEPADAALLESMPQPINPFKAGAAPGLNSSSAAAAAAPAKQFVQSPARPQEQKPAATVFAPPKVVGKPSSAANLAISIPEADSRSEGPLFSSITESANQDNPNQGWQKKLAIAAVAAIVLASAYLGWTKWRSVSASPAAMETAAPEPQVQTVTENETAKTSPAQTASLSNTSSATNQAGKQGLPSTRGGGQSGNAQSAKALSSSAISSATPSLTPPARIAGAGSPLERLMVRGETAKAAPDATDDTSAPEPPPVDVSSNHADAALSGLVGSLATNLPKPAGQAFKVSQGISQGLLVKKVAPVYPRQALQARIEGPVQLQANVGKDGAISSVQVVSGDSVLARAAVDAVRQWKYKPYYLDNQPIAIQTMITVDFRLP